MIKPIPVILDTDIGDDIDDAIALCLALQCPEIKLLGVATVFKNVEKRANMARAILHAAGRDDIPVYAGESRCLRQTEMFRKKIDFDVLPWTYIEELDAYAKDMGKDAIDFYIETLENAKEPVTIVTIGALTNVATLLRRRPDLIPKINNFTIMGGAYDMNFQEYNFSCDPEAVNVVFESKVPVTAVGVDVTFKCAFSEENRKRVVESTSNVLKLLVKITKRWYAPIFLHDPLALFCCFDRRYVTFAKRQMLVEESGDYTRGLVVNLSNHNWLKPADESHIEYAVSVDGPSFANECTRRLLQFDRTSAAMMKAQ